MLKRFGGWSLRRLFGCFSAPETCFHGLFCLPCLYAQTEYSERGGTGDYGNMGRVRPKKQTEAVLSEYRQRISRGFASTGVGVSESSRPACFNHLIAGP